MGHFAVEVEFGAHILGSEHDLVHAFPQKKPGGRFQKDHQEGKPEVIGRVFKDDKGRQDHAYNTQGNHAQSSRDDFPFLLAHEQEVFFEMSR